MDLSQQYACAHEHVVNNNNNNKNSNSNKQHLNPEMSPQTILKMQDSIHVLAKKIFLTELVLTSFWIQVLIRAV